MTSVPPPPPPPAAEPCAWDWLRSTGSLGGAGAAMALTVTLSAANVAAHLMRYERPRLQRYAVRIFMLPPVYAVASYVSLCFPVVAFYSDTLRDVYEAYALYNFVALCLAYMGGAAMLVDRWRVDDHRFPASWWWGTCCCGSLRLDGLFLRRVMQGVLQFVVVRVLLVIASIVTYAVGVYCEGHLDFSCFYVYGLIVYNISICVALYALLLFYFASAHILRPFNPVGKFVMIKLVIFVTWCQAEILAILATAGVISACGTVGAADTDNEQDARNELVRSLQDFLIVLECVFAAAANLFTYPSSDFRNRNVTRMPPLKALWHMLSVYDVWRDTDHTFSMQYRDSVDVATDEDDCVSPAYAGPSADCENGNGATQTPRENGTTHAPSKTQSAAAPVVSASGTHPAAPARHTAQQRRASTGEEEQLEASGGGGATQAPRQATML